MNARVEWAKPKISELLGYNKLKIIQFTEESHQHISVY